MFRNFLSSFFPMDRSAAASSPGGVWVNPFTWARYRTVSVFLLVLGVYVFAMSSYLDTLWNLIPLFGMLVINYFYWRNKSDHFKLGDSNIGMIVSARPSLVAVTTNLTKGFANYPIVQIITYYPGKNDRIGDTIPTVGTYVAAVDEEIPHWIGFHPIPVKYANGNKKVLEKCMNRYTNQELEQLTNRLKEVPKPFEVGLYLVEKETSDWKDSEFKIHN